MFNGYQKFLVLEFSEMENTVFFWAKKFDENTKSTYYWRVLVLEEGGKGLFWAKKLMGRLYLLITEKFLVWTSLRWEIRSFFESKSWLKDDIYWLLKIYCFELFGDGNRVCFSAKKLMERLYLLGLFELFMTF